MAPVRAADRAEALPLPILMTSILCVKVGQPLSGRTSAAIHPDLIIDIEEGYQVLQARCINLAQQDAVEYAADHADQRDRPTLEIAQDTPLFVKPSATSTQSQFVQLGETNFMSMLQTCWSSCSCTY